MAKKIDFKNDSCHKIGQILKFVVFIHPLVVLSLKDEPNQILLRIDEDFEQLCQLMGSMSHQSLFIPGKHIQIAVLH